MQNILLWLTEDLPAGNTEHHGPSGFCEINQSKLYSVFKCVSYLLTCPEGKMKSLQLER